MGLKDWQVIDKLRKLTNIQPQISLGIASSYVG